METTPPNDLLQAVTPTSLWKKNLPRRIFHNEMPLAPPTPVTDSTRIDNKSVSGDVMGDQSSSILHLDEMSLSLLDVKPAPPKAASNSKGANILPPMPAASSHSQIPEVRSRIPKLMPIKPNSSASGVLSKSPSEIATQPRAAGATYIVTPPVRSPSPPAAHSDPEVSLADYLKPVEILAVTRVFDDSTLAEDSTLASENDFLAAQTVQQGTQATSVGSHSLNRMKPPVPNDARPDDVGKDKNASPSFNLMEFSSTHSKITADLSKITADLSKIDSLKPPESLQNSCGSVSNYLTPEPSDVGDSSVGGGGATSLESSTWEKSNSTLTTKSLSYQHSGSTSSVATLPSASTEQPVPSTISQSVVSNRLIELEGEPLRTSSRVSAISTAASEVVTNQDIQSAAPSLADASELAALSQMAVTLQTAAISQAATTLQTAASLQAATALQIAAVSHMVTVSSPASVQSPQAVHVNTGNDVSNESVIELPPPATASNRSTGSGKGSRNVSPICLDELDSHSESGWSMVSELSDASKPVYSDAEIKALMSGDIFRHLTLNRQPTSVSQSLVGNRPDVAHYSKSASHCSSSQVSIEDKPQAHSSRASSRDGPIVDSFFDVDEGRFSAKSALSQMEADSVGLSYQTSRLFNEPSGLSVNSIRELSSTVSSAANTPSTSFDQIVKQTVADRMSGLESFNSPEELCAPADISVHNEEVSHQQPPSLREHSMGSTLTQGANSTWHSRHENSDITSYAHHQSNQSLQSSASRSNTASRESVSTNTSHSTMLKNKSPPAEASHLSLTSNALGVSCTADVSGATNNSIAQSSMSTFTAITPGQPICESSHIQKTGLASPSDRTGRHLSQVEESRPAAASRSDTEASEVTRAMSECMDNGAKATQVYDWLKSNGDEYVTQSDPATMQHSDDTTAHPHVSHMNSAYEAAKVSPVKADETASVTIVNDAIDNTHMTSMRTMLYPDQESTMLACDSTPCPSKQCTESSQLVMKLIEVPSTLLVPGVHCTRTNITVELPVNNLTDRWLRVAATLVEHKINGQLSAADVLYFKQLNSPIRPMVKHTIPIYINTTVAGCHELWVSLEVNGEDNAPVAIRVRLDIEKPRVELLDNRDGILDFGVVPYGCTKRVTLTLCNKSRVSTSLLIKVISDEDTRGRMGLEAGKRGQASQPAEDPTRLKLTLPSSQHVDGSHTQTLFVSFSSPLRHDKAGSPETIRRVIAVYQSTAISSEPLLCVNTRCICGHASVQVPAKYHKFEMRCGAQSSSSEQVVVRNSGDVPIDVSLSLSDTQHFSISPNFLSLRPSETGSYQLTFSTHNITDYYNSVNCKVTATIEPDGIKCAIDVKGMVDPPSAIPSHMSALACSSQVKPLPLAGSKMKIKCSPTVIKFAGVDLNERKYNTVKILNYYDTPLKLNVDIDKSEFQISTVIDGVEQLSSSRQAIIPVSSSATDTYNIRVCFEPRQLGFLKARLKFQNRDKTITMRLNIYGYGGPSLVEPVLESSSTSGVYNISAGDIHNKEHFSHQFYLRNVGYQRAFVLTQCFSGAGCTEPLELSRIQMLPRSLVVSPADARKVMMHMRITEREKVLCDRSMDVIASVRVTYVDQVLRTILQRLTAVYPELIDNQIKPFLTSISDDEGSDATVNMPDEAVNVNLFKHSLRSFIINVYAEPRKAATAVPRPLDVLQPCNTSPRGLSVSTRSLTFFTEKPKETQELVVAIRNRGTSDIPVKFSSLRSPFKCKSRSSILCAKNKGSLKVTFTADCMGRWQEELTITSPDKSVCVELIGKCGASY